MNLEDALKATAFWAEGDAILKEEGDEAVDVPPVSEDTVVADNNRSLAEIERVLSGATTRR